MQSQEYKNAFEQTKECNQGNAFGLYRCKSFVVSSQLYASPAYVQEKSQLYASPAYVQESSQLYASPAYVQEKSQLYASPAYIKQ
jgi:hypothetical protein